MMLIRDVIRDREPYSMKSSASVQEAAEFMAARNVGAVCVVDEGGKLLGVFSERVVNLADKWSNALTVASQVANRR